MQRVLEYLKKHSILSGGKAEVEALWARGPSAVRDAALRARLEEFLGEKAPKTFFFNEAGPAIARDRPNHHANPFGLLRSVIERLVMLPAMAPFIDGMVLYDGTVDALALDVAVAATALCDIYVGDPQSKGMNGLWHAIAVSGDWVYFARDGSVTERVIADRVADAVIWSHADLHEKVRSLVGHVRPEMRLVALVSAFCTRKELDLIYRPRVCVLEDG